MVIQYPNGKPYRPIQRIAAPQLDHGIKYGNRGMTLEEDINLTNQYYLEKNIAIIHKKPTPVQIVHVDYPKRSKAKITEAYFKKPSTTDYNGIYKGKYIDFEVKETRQKTAFPLKNFHEHQISHMKQILDHGGICFVILKFTSFDNVYLLEALHFINHWNNHLRGGRKSIPKKMIEEEAHVIPQGFNPRIDYIKVIDKLYYQEVE